MYTECPHLSFRLEKFIEFWAEKFVYWSNSNENIPPDGGLLCTLEIAANIVIMGNIFQLKIPSTF